MSELLAAQTVPVPEVFDMDTPHGKIAAAFYQDWIIMWRTGRLQFPAQLEADQYEDWLLGMAVTVEYRAEQRERQFGNQSAGENHG